MNRRPPRPALFPYTPLSRSPAAPPSRETEPPLAAPPLREAAPPPAAQDPSREEKRARDRKSTRLNSSHANISYAVFCLKKKTTTPQRRSPAPGIQRTCHPFP